MKVSVEISMYPLLEQYCQPILEFINRLEQTPTVTIQRNSMSTHIFGDYHAVINILDHEMLQVFEQIPETIFIIKLIGTDREKVVIDACE